MSEFTTFGEIHFDILREIGSIGAGNAATSLSKMLDKRVYMQVPQVKLLDFKDVSEVMGGSENIIIGLLVGMSGDLNGMMMFLINLRSAHSLVNMLFGNVPQSNKAADDFTDMEISAIQEVGNILLSSYLGSLSTLIDKSITQSIPYLCIDMAGAILSVPAIEFGKVADKALFIESLFSTDDKPQDNSSENVSGYFVLVPDPPSFDVILSVLGVYR
ncbi:chemotaxis protein CheC [Clostridia bacterium]|nr:chemotaxis protein CheC [Clostridia bacterium]